MKNSIKLTGVLALAGLSALIVAPSATHATGIGYETCKSYDCVSMVRTKANTFHLTKGVLKLTKDFINKVEAKAIERFNGVATTEGLKFQQRIYAVVSKKFLDVSLLLRNEQMGGKIKNADKLAKVTYDLSEIFKIKSEIAGGNYHGGNYYFDKYFKADLIKSPYDLLSDAAKALREKLDNPYVVKNSDYDTAKKFYDENKSKVGDKTIPAETAKSLADEMNKLKDKLVLADATLANLMDALKNAANDLKDKLDNPNVLRNGAYDNAKGFYDENKGKVGDNTLSPDTLKDLTKQFKDKGDALSYEAWVNNLLDAARELKNALDKPSVQKNGAYDSAKKFYEDNIAKAENKKLPREEAERLAVEFKAHKDRLSFTQEGNTTNNTNGDTIVAGDTVKEFFKDITGALKTNQGTSISQLFKKHFENQKASGYYFDGEYVLGIGEGSENVLRDGTTKEDLTKFLPKDSSLMLVAVGNRVERFSLVDSKYVKFYNGKVVGLREGGSEQTSEALKVMNNYNKGFLSSIDGYYGFAPFRDKGSANGFVREQKMAGAQVVKIANTGKYMVLFKSEAIES